jgi:hypothetical protein
MTPSAALDTLAEMGVGSLAFLAGAVATLARCGLGLVVADRPPSARHAPFRERGPARAAVWLAAIVLFACGTRSELDVPQDWHGRPPPPFGGAPTTNVVTFAIQHVYLGDTTRAGAPSSAAWKDFGFQLDGKTTEASSTDVCSLRAGAPVAVQDDGNLGRDNSWGLIVLPTLESALLEPDWSDGETSVLINGGYTLQIQIVGFSDDPHQSAIGLSARVFESAPYPTHNPAFDTTTDWPVLDVSLKDGQTIAGGAKVEFPNAYVSGGTFVSGPSTAPLAWGSSSSLFPPTTGTGIFYPRLVIHHPVITFDHVSHSDAVNGTIAGVLYPEEFIDGLRTRPPEPVLCGSVMDSVGDVIRQDADILDDGSNAPNTPCTAISIGIGFDAKLIANPTKVAPMPTPPPDPCQ